MTATMTAVKAKSAKKVSAKASAKQTAKQPHVMASLPPHFSKLLYSVDEASAAMSVSRWLMNKMIPSGAIRSLKVEGRRCVPIAALEQYIEERLSQSA